MFFQALLKRFERLQFVDSGKSHKLRGKQSLGGVWFGQDSSLLKRYQNIFALHRVYIRKHTILKTWICPFCVIFPSFIVLDSCLLIHFYDVCIKSKTNLVLVYSPTCKNARVCIECGCYFFRPYYACIYINCFVN